MGIIIPIKEVLRYLGYNRAGCTDTNVVEIANQAIKELQKVGNPKSVYNVFPITSATDDCVCFGGMEVRSANLAKNLKGCSEVALFAATIGAKVDMLIKKYAVYSMSRSVVFQAAASAMIEQYCDDTQKEIEAKINAEGKYLRPRFSPGYGDFSLEHQTEIFRLLDLERKIGVTLTDALIMVPSKSVTAVIGISPTNQNCVIQGCEVCSQKDCPYRRENDLN